MEIINGILMTLLGIGAITFFILALNEKGKSK